MRAPTIRPFRNTEVRNFVSLLCDGYAVEGARSMADFIAAYREKCAAHPDAKLIATLDDLDQAFYTSGHAIDAHHIDDTEGHDLGGLDPAAYENGAHLGYLTTTSEFPIRRANFLKKAAGVSFAGLAGKLMWDLDPNKPDVFALNAAPDDALAPVMLVQIVPVAMAADALCAFPNGYFTCDLSPFENHALARHLEERYGYALFGIGASYIGFLKTRALTGEEGAALAADLCSLFSDASGGAFASRVADTLERSPWLFLNYGGG
jgi:hypothetical protein